MSVDSQQKVRDPDYYFGENAIVFLIENTLFRVPRKLMLEGSWFSDVLETDMNVPQECLEGQSNDHLIAPQGIAASDFRSLLSILTARALDGYPTLTKQECAGVLHLSTMWAFDKVRNLVIQWINKSGPLPMDRLDLAMTGRARDWLEQAYMQLCMKDAPLTREATRLGPQRFFAISQIREKRTIARTLAVTLETSRQQQQRGSPGGSYWVMVDGVSTLVHHPAPSGLSARESCWVKSSDINYHVNQRSNFDIGLVLREYPELDLPPCSHTCYQ